VPARRMRVEVYDESGNRYTIAFQGRVTRDNALRIFDIVELLGGMHGVESEVERKGEASKIQKVRFVIERHFPAVWFDAKEARSTYETEVKEPISLSTVSTYLTRLANRGILLKSRESNKVRYRLISQSLQKMFNPEHLR